ncbi:MAG: aldo/keto reductase [Gammaproteobacteria bacterium]|jgi:aryl-alcohol dehydrogenase-like predicted oxidoreductase|nr:aldo/keto reductase [Gammaproteobacteria bacterium]
MKISLLKGVVAMAYAMQFRVLGASGLKVSAQGLGCMGMAEFYGAPDLAEAERTVRRAIELGVNLFDTADVYGPHTNEEFLGKIFADYPRDTLVIATKGGILRDPKDPTKRGTDNSPEYMRSAIEASLKRLNTSYIDLYYVHRIANEGRDIEATMAALAELVKEGKIRHIGLSEASPEVIERAHKVHPVAAVQTEYSLWRREPEVDGVLATCRKLGIAFVPYSPLGRGFLTGAVKPDTLEKGDFRTALPRFQGENLAHNMKIVDAVKALAAEKGCTPAQLALAWVMAQGNDIVPIPGTKRVKYLEDNLGALKVNLTAADLKRLDEIAPVGAAKGLRYAPAAMAAYGFKADREISAPEKKTSFVVHGGSGEAHAEAPTAAKP